MTIVCIEPLPNGAHRNQTTSSTLTVPDGRAVIPPDMELMYANCALSLTTAKKLAGLHTNGGGRGRGHGGGKDRTGGLPGLRQGRGGPPIQQSLIPGAAGNFERRYIP